MKLLNFLPLNSIRYFVSEIKEGNKRKKAIEDTMKEAGLDPKNYWHWTQEDHRRESEIGKRIFKERGIKRGWNE